MNLLHIDSSILGQQSVTRELSAAVVGHLRSARPGMLVRHRDLDAAPIPHLSAASLAKADAAAAAVDDAILQEFIDANVVVLGAPFYNFGIPSTLKAWIDRIAVAGRTFRYGESGAVGLAGGKRVIVASGRGGVYGDANPADFQEAYLRQVFGFLGVQDLHVIRAEGVALSAQHRAEALAGAHAAIARPLRLAA